jgi:hypothetical protein
VQDIEFIAVERIEEVLQLIFVWNNITILYTYYIHII